MNQKIHVGGECFQYGKRLELVCFSQYGGAELENSSDNIAQLAIQGPKAISVLQKLMDIDLATIPYYTFKVGTFASEENVIISNTGYTGAGGFELYFYPSAADSIWKAIFEAGEEYGIKPIGLGARDTLRLEMGFCLYGNDLDDTTSPIEAGLGWITKFVEGKDFVNRPMLENRKRKVLPVNWLALKWLIAEFPVMAMNW